MRIRLATLLGVLLYLSAVAPSIADTVTHCKAGEVSYFSCKLTNSVKIVSLCGGPDLATKIENGVSNIWLQYRFGPLGNPELVFPSKKQDSVEQFEGFWSQHKPIPHDDTWGFDEMVTFKNGSAEYSILIARQEDEFYGITAKQSGRHISMQCEGLSATTHAQKGDTNRKFIDLVRALHRGM